MKKKLKIWSEAELVDTFSLKKEIGKGNLLDEWINIPSVELNAMEKEIFEKILQEVTIHISSWNEEDLKMNFIAFVIFLSNLRTTERYSTYYEKIIESEVEGHFLKIKTDFMIAKGVLDMVKTPYFHFQEYKKDKDPYGDPIAQLLESFLIAFDKNKNNKPLYGCYIIGRFWYFVTYQPKIYTVSKAYDCTDKQDLLQIISILRKFKEILETRLLD
jgi:hypothetical protein